jgi:xanthine dehydrogenase YagS FAD-binding subunit
MKTFDYMVADDLGAAVNALDGSGAYLKAGGMDAVDMMKEGILEPDSVLSIHKAADGRSITSGGAGVRIGCLTTLADIGRNAMLREQFPGFHTAAAHAATPQVREKATIAGNLCQRPRCWYFRSADFDCLKKGGHTCYAPEGENAYHAVFGGGPCYIVHPSNCAPPLMAAGAQLVVRSADGERTIPLTEFFVLPADRLREENVLQEGDVITEVIVPAFPSQSATIEIREKQSFDWPLAIASAARMENGWKVCLGAVAPIPWMAEGANDVLGNKDVTPELAKEAGEAVAQGAAPLSGNAYKVKLIAVAVERALKKAAGMEIPA